MLTLFPERGAEAKPRDGHEQQVSTELTILVATSQQSCSRIKRSYHGNVQKGNSAAAMAKDRDQVAHAVGSEDAFETPGADDSATAEGGQGDRVQSLERLQPAVEGQRHFERGTSKMYYEWKEHYGILTKKDKKATVGRKAWENGSAGSSGAWPIPSPRALRRLTPWVQKETSTGASRTQPGDTSEAEMEVDEQWQHVRPPSSSTSAAANVTTKSVPVESDPDLDAGEENVGCKLTQGIPPPPGRKLK